MLLTYLSKFIKELMLKVLLFSLFDVFDHLFDQLVAILANDDVEISSERLLLIDFFTGSNFCTPSLWSLIIWVTFQQSLLMFFESFIKYALSGIHQLNFIDKFNVITDG